MAELIITEKPKSALRIAQSLADGKPVKESNKGVPYYRLKRGGKEIIVACAVGHLFGFGEREKKKWSYPVFDIVWKPNYEISKSAGYSKKYLETIKKLSKNANQYTIATDYDIEGEVIGLNCIRFICNQKDSARMKFSTLTKNELTDAYENKSNHIDWGLALAGEARHEMDWYWGINTSRALTAAIKKDGMFKILSAGRVQGPALKIIVERELEIKEFKPVPYWQIELQGEVRNGKIIAWHKTGKFWQIDKATEVMKKVHEQKKGRVVEITRKEFLQNPPVPFDLTTLQTEAYRCFGINPKETQAIAQNLYLSGLISYPRTSSQILPASIGYRKIIAELAKQNEYKELCLKLLEQEGELKPNNGKKTDPAHPAIFPTGEWQELHGKEKKVYDLIVRRTLASFGKVATRETVNVTIDVNAELFVASGTRTTSKGWHIFYAPYIKLEEEELVKVDKDEEVKIKRIVLHAEETKPARRYTPASIIRELESKNLGTKCLTANNFVKINSDNQIHIENIAELFDDLYSNAPLKSKGMSIAINHKKTCFSFNSFDEIQSQFNLVSRRKLKEHEAVYRIEYADGSFIEVTEEHPLLIFDDFSKECSYISAKHIEKGMKSVTSVTFPEKKRGIICTWEQFLNSCSLYTRLYGVTRDLQALRKRQNLSQYSFGSKYRMLQARVSAYENSGIAPLYVIKNLQLSKPEVLSSGNHARPIKNPFPLYMTSSLARILANLVGDASIDTVKIGRENCYDFRYHNTNPDLINRFVNDIKSVFGVNVVPKLKKLKEGHLPIYYIRIPAIIGRIISILFPEVIKKNAVKIPQEFYPEFIGALFDDEGHTMKSEPKLFISNTNFTLLEVLKEMLSTLGIYSSLERKQFKLYIRRKEDLQRFLEKIPIHSVEKKQRLIDKLTNKYSWKQYPILKRERDILTLLALAPNKELELKEIAKNIEVSIPNVRQALYPLREKGFITQKVVGISEYPRKKITYKLVRPIEGTFYICIDETVISPDFITKTITAVKKINYDGYAYDITNVLENPNFIMSNGVVVHNSTRSEIIDTLFRRGYIKGKAIEATELGIKTVEILEKYSPEIVDEELTRHFEIEMDEIREGKKKKEEVIEEAKEVLVKILKDFKGKEREIGAGLRKANIEARDAESNLGICPVCKEGNLMVRRGKFGRFAACSKYPDCKTTFKLPASGMISPSNKLCEHCRYPMLNMIRKGKKPQEVCLNPECPSKHVDENLYKDRVCDKCGKGKMVLRKSVYGGFLACNQYPKCKNIESLSK